MRDKGSDQKPLFFLSYARLPQADSGSADPNSWVKKLYDGLCEHIMQLTDLPRGAKAGFLDQGVTTGTRSAEQLAANVAGCRVFVPLYSPRYFVSEQCGREWWAFSQRQINQRVRGGASATGAIVPALWVPVEPTQMPQVARDLQFNHAAFGEHYAEEGFYGLTKLRYFRDDYERAVYRLAKQIVRVADEVALEEGHAYSDYESLPSAFPSNFWPSAPKFDVSIIACTRSDLPPGRTPVYYGDRPRDWNPYHPASTMPLGDHAADVIRAMDYDVRFRDFDQDADNTVRPGARAPGILLVDPWVLRNPTHRALLSQLDEVAPPWLTVVVPWNRQDPGSHADKGPALAELETVMPRLLRLSRSSSRTAVGGVATLEALHEVLPRVVRHAVEEFNGSIQNPSYPFPRLRGPDPNAEAHGDRAT
ncbi:TIR-like protein FxsC [Streptomyces ossamyceticus]|nr:TIR-like protein FxsC [Streptomyces ossamyceticus]